MNSEIMYRTESAYGSGVRSIEDVLFYEIYELGNLDVLTTQAESLAGEDAVWFACMRQSLETPLNEDWAKKIISQVVTKLNQVYNRNLKYALWLASHEQVQSLYGATKEDMDAYRIGDVILSNLGADGILFGYEQFPEPLRFPNRSHTNLFHK